MGKDTIRSLDVREQCRLRLPVWFGSRDNYQHGLRELLANASDEISNNFDCGEITVTLYEDNKTITVSDTGRGIPIEGETNGVKNYELLFCALFSGTNYDNADNGKITTGANGVGTCVLNHSSELFEVVSARNKMQSIVRFEDGGNLTHSEFGVKSDTPHGTAITFKLDAEVYTKVEYDAEEIKLMLKSLAGVNNKLSIHFEHIGTAETYGYESLQDYLEENSVNIISTTHSFADKQYNLENESNTILCSWNVSTEPFQNTFLNYTNLIEQGAIYDGFIDGMKKVFTKSSKSKFTNLDIEMSFGMVVSVLSNNVEFTNQTKFSTNKQLYKKLVSEYIVSNMEIFKAENPQEFDKILKHLQQINSFNSKNEASIKNIKKKLVEGNSLTNRIKKFIDCRTKDTTKRELYIVEGDSALGSCKQSRNAEFQGLMPIRGKILNCLKADYDKIFKSDIIIDLLKLLGCGIEVKSKHNKDLNTFNLDNLRWDKIILCTDADVDGYQIRTLLLTMFYRLIPTLIEKGYIYIADTPLYEVECKGKTYFAYNDQEKTELLSKLDKCKIQRSKGLGENDPEMMALTTMNPATRKLIRVTMDTAKDASDTFDMLLGDNLQGRKDYIAENFDKYLLEVE